MHIMYMCVYMYNIYIYIYIYIHIYTYVCTYSFPNGQDKSGSIDATEMQDLPVRLSGLNGANMYTCMYVYIYIYIYIEREI